MEKHKAHGWEEQPPASLCTHAVTGRNPGPQPEADSPFSASLSSWETDLAPLILSFLLCKEGWVGITGANYS